VPDLVAVVDVDDREERRRGDRRDADGCRGQVEEASGSVHRGII
jgi:hypothetical protein